MNKLLPFYYKMIIINNDLDNYIGFLGNDTLLAWHMVTVNTIENYIATQNCYAVVCISGYNKDTGTVKINNITILSDLYYNDRLQTPNTMRTLIPIKKNQTLSVYSPKSFASSFAIYSMD